jgi:hypothetical protein
MSLVDILGSKTRTFGPRSGTPEPVWESAEAAPEKDAMAVIATAAMHARNAL